MLVAVLVLATVLIGVVRSTMATGAMEDWRTETTATWKATIAQMSRIEAQQAVILAELRQRRTKGD